MTRVVKALRWAMSTPGRHDISIIVVGVYTILHKLGVL